MIFVRNLAVPDVASAGGSALLIFIRELLRVARWTESSNNGDAAWPGVGGVVNNLVAQPADLSVDPAYRGRITSASNPFNSGMVGNIISLLAVNDQNRSMWRITKYIDANNIEVDPMGFTPWNWIAESGITGWVTKCTTALTATTATALWNAPSPNKNQARLLYSALDAAILYARPKGQVPLATETTGITYANNADYKHIMHMVADGPNVLIWWSTEDDPFACVMWGELEDADALDTDPNFILGRDNASAIQLCYWAMYMLNGADANIISYVTVPKRNWTAQLLSNYFAYFNSRLMNGRPGFAPLRSPWVCLANTITVGACVRGRLPLVAQTYTGYERLRPLDAAGGWLHAYVGVAVPRNGPYDQLPLVPV
jgi:hypothetical protein